MMGLSTQIIWWKHDVICIQDYLLSQLSLSLLDIKDKLTCYESSAKRNRGGDRLPGGFV